MEKKILDKLESVAAQSADRREFLKKAGKAAVTVPAVAMLLSAHATPAAASGRYGRGKAGGASNRRGGRSAEHSRRAFGHSHKKTR